MLFNQFLDETPAPVAVRQSCRLAGDWWPVDGRYLDGQAHHHDRSARPGFLRGGIDKLNDVEIYGFMTIYILRKVNSHNTKESYILEDTSTQKYSFQGFYILQKIVSDEVEIFSSTRQF